MRFAVFADAHIGRSIPLAIADHRRQAFERALIKVVDTTIEAAVDYVFICGDLFERRTLRPHMVQFVHNELYRLAWETEARHGKELKILIVRGNHDGRSQSDALDYIKHPLARYLHVFSDEDLTYSDGRIYVVGLNYYDMIEAAFESLVKPAFEGAKGTRIFMLHGFVSNYNDVPPGDQSLSLDQLAEVNPDYVFTGHYHKRCLPKRLGNGGWLLTPGSTEVYDFAEDVDKGFYIIDTDTLDFRWTTIEPLHLMRQVKVTGGIKRESPAWYEEKILEEVKVFAQELKSSKREGYLRVKVEGSLSEGWPSDIEDERLNDLLAVEPRLIWVDVDTLELDLPLSVARPQAENKDVAEYFRDLGGFSEDIREIHGKVRDSLEEEASTKTGLLTPTQREPLVTEWLRLFESREFGEARS